PNSSETDDWYRSLKLGQVIHGEFRKMRNYAFHQKFFALLNLAFDYWKPGEINSKYGVPEKNFERFRKDLIILAGYFHLVIRLDGTTRPEADSISFAKMDNDEFQKLYSNVLNVILKKIPMMAEIGEERINELTDKFLEFA
ncbi:MAG: DUF1367 family protein, partial [Planctomycetes bacterium]|nr:DUF1367 family protein [Planctomycetota bacterium]